ncbi:MAG: NTP transferase domain-containing protein [Candidatus Marinimicrobia bacterium]|nr:NTP transferase domain-containing protein [Candidatus Neomarinimicrobiota bacterium]
MNVGAIILAAGKSERFGSPKVLQSFLEQPYTIRILNNLQSAGISSDNVVLILGHKFEEFRPQLPDLGSTKIIDNLNYELGQFSSIRAGIAEHTETAVQGVLMCLVDQPHLLPETFQAVLDAAQDNPEKIIIPTYQDRGGHPVFIPEYLFQVILDHSDVNTLRDVFNQHRESIKRISVDDPGLLKDTDYPEDLEDMESLYIEKHTNSDK